MKILASNSDSLKAHGDARVAHTRYVLAIVDEEARFTSVCYAGRTEGDPPTWIFHSNHLAGTPEAHALDEAIAIRIAAAKKRGDLAKHAEQVGPAHRFATLTEARDALCPWANRELRGPRHAR
jgi:hypothetical protein